MFNTKIQPILTYGSEVWFYHDSQDIENVHTKFCKYVLKLGWNAPNIFVRGELGRRSLFSHRLKIALKYWFRLQHMNDDKISYLCYKSQYRWTEEGKHCWAYFIKHFLINYEYGHVWFHQSVGNEQLFLLDFSQRLADIDMQSWQESLNSSSGLKNYCAIKTLFSCELYLDKIENSYHRSLLIELRGCMLPLEYTLGFYHNVQLENRLCPLCKSALDTNLMSVCI